MPMEYREHRVPSPLSAVVECVWFLRIESGGAAAGAGVGGGELQRVLPDGCMEAILHLGAPFAAVSGSGVRTRQAASLLVGMLTRPMLLQAPRAAVDTMGIRFRPGGAAVFVDMPLAEIADGAVGLDDLWGAAGRRFVERIGVARGDAARVEVVVRELTLRLARAERDRSGGSRDRLLGYVVQRLVTSAGTVNIGRVASEVGVTPRHLQRRFLDRVGVGPKLLARILRFQNTLRQRSAETPVEWARVAVDCGYADQSHLIREYAAFAGETPASLLAAEGELSSYFTAPQRLATLLGARR